MKHEISELSYSHDALEPFIDEKTMKIHHQKHHQGYVDKLNASLEGSGFEDKSLDHLLKNLSDLPEEIRASVRNNGGGHANHIFFFDGMTPDNKKKPEGNLLKSLEDFFGKFDEFKKEFERVSELHFGSGWSWLVVDGSNGNLRVYSMKDHNSPLTKGDIPLLTLDVWEHAYYLKYQNRRGDYIKSWWNLVNWEKVSERLESAA